VDDKGALPLLGVFARSVELLENTRVEFLPRVRECAGEKEADWEGIEH